MGSQCWGPEEFSSARALALQVRMMTLDQVARGWFGQGEECRERAEAGLNRLEKAGLIERLVMEAHPIVPQSRPLFSWKAGRALPREERFADVAERSRRRWGHAHAPVVVYRATKRACRAFGTFVDALDARHFEATHDLHLAEVFVLYRRRKPRAVANWLGEAAFPKLGFEIRGMKDPDAFLVDPQGNGQRVIEFTGTYKEEHLRALHEHCSGGAVRKLARQRFNGVLSRLYPAGGIDYELW